jgi:hypothetical protein
MKMPFEAPVAGVFRAALGRRETGVLLQARQNASQVFGLASGRTRQTASGSSAAVPVSASAEKKEYEKNDH